MEQEIRDLERQMGETPPNTREPIEPGATASWRKIINFLMIITVLVLMSAGPIMRGMGHYLVLEDDLEKSSLIVVLGGSPAIRSAEAADLYVDGAASRVFVSRGFLDRADLVKDIDVSQAGEWGLAEKILTARGVPKEAIIIDGEFVVSTLAEAKRVRGFLSSQELKSIILVTSKSNSRRAASIFRKILGPGVLVISRPSRYDRFDPDDWWNHRGMAKQVVLEYQKIVFSWFETFGEGD